MEFGYTKKRILCGKMDSDEEDSELAPFGCDRTGCMCPGGRCRFGSTLPSRPDFFFDAASSEPVASSKLAFLKPLLEPVAIAGVIANSAKHIEDLPELFPISKPEPVAISEPVANPVAKPVAKPVVKPLPEPVAISGPVANPVSKPVAVNESVSQSCNKSSNKSSRTQTTPRAPRAPRVTNTKVAANVASDAKAPKKRIRKRVRATSTKTPRKTKSARAASGRRVDSSSEDEDFGLSEVQRTKNDAFEIRFNHLYKPNAKLPDARYSFGQCKGKFVSEVVVGGQEVLTDGIKNERFRGIAYLRWMLSDAFKPRPGNARLLRAVRAHSKAYDHFMNTLQPAIQ